MNTMSMLMISSFSNVFLNFRGRGILDFDLFFYHGDVGTNEIFWSTIWVYWWQSAILTIRYNLIMLFHQLRSLEVEIVLYELEVITWNRAISWAHWNWPKLFLNLFSSINIEIWNTGLTKKTGWITSMHFLNSYLLKRWSIIALICRSI